MFAEGGRQTRKNKEATELLQYSLGRGSLPENLTYCGVSSTRNAFFRVSLYDLVTSSFSTGIRCTLYSSASGFLTVVLYWIGLYEASNKWKWFFEIDFAPAIGYFAKRAGVLQRPTRGPLVNASICSYFLCIQAGVLVIRQIRVIKWGLKCAENFLDVYGPGAPTPYGWWLSCFGVMAGACCGGRPCHVALFRVSIVSYLRCCGRS
ncbi:hypothetical protein EI94DRAFT_748462 [Lactarius quietus]|nr:hypothetical protein EI94DRAFT_748462 [Lactarius quietus]